MTRHTNTPISSDKQYYQSMLLDMVEPLIPHYSKEGAHLHLGNTAAAYGNRIGEMEAFSRVLWGMIPYWAGGGRHLELLSIYQKGFVAGTTPSSFEFWGHLGDCDQRMVEMAAISFGILVIPELLWEPLSKPEQDNLASWLNEINLHSQPENNWQFFKVVTNLALKSVGKEWNQRQVADAMEKYESFYLGNGWYADGKRPQMDYYTSFAIHYYCLIYTKYMEDTQPKTAALYRKRAKQFAQSFIYWFDDEGKALAFGRSQTYRFAQAAFWSMCVFTELDCFPLGILKGLISRHMEYWMRQPIFDNGHILTVGYTYPNLFISERYNASGSPYWAFKTFAFLALPDDHPFWSVPAEPLPKLDTPKLIKECRMIMSRSNYDVSALTSGQYPTIEHPHAAEKYAKFAYSSRFSFSVPRSYYNLEELAPDNMLCFYAHGMYYVRRKCESFELFEQELVSVWKPLAEITVETHLIPTKAGHIRKHSITSSIDCVAYECGFSYPQNKNEIEILEKDKLAIVSDPHGKSVVFSNTGKGLVIHAAPNTNLSFPITCIPAVCCEIKQGENFLESTIETKFTEKSVIVGGDCYEIYDK